MQRILDRLPLIIAGIAAFAISGVAPFVIGGTDSMAAPPIAAALNIRNASFAPIGNAKPAPYGWLHFCEAQPDECEMALMLPKIVPLTSQTWAELNWINTIVNHEIAPIGDEDHYKIYEQ